ncbi:MAG: hypothetical protein EOM90_13895 [Alphaproteobacteria bacterium]|nr:hypothetical protein [Alphaproteobacteria bacterium]
MVIRSFVSDENFGTAVGWDGTILRTTNGGITYTDDPDIKRKNSYYLKQNHPNPFHHNTVIEFFLPCESHVTLEIFNESGCLVRTLEDEHFNKGCHSVIWDGKNNKGTKVDSGTYLCAMKTNDFRNTIKLIISQ